MVQVPTDSNMSDMNTKPLGGQKKVNKIAKMIVRILALEGLQPMVTEAFMKEKENDQCGLEEVEEFNEVWKAATIAFVMKITIGFAAMTFAMWKLYKNIETRYEEAMGITRFRTDEAEFRLVELEIAIRENEDDEDKINTLRDMPGDFLVD